MITKKEQAFIDGAVRSMRDMHRLLPRETTPGLQIAALRWMLADSPRADSIVRTSQIALCKLLELYPVASKDYILQRDFNALRTPIITRLLTTYTRLYQNSGIGSWPMPERESILFSCYALNNGMWNALLFHRASLRALIAAYEQQEALSAVLPKLNDVRAKLANDVMDQNTTSLDRKRAARDASGTCYLCSAPKPRGSQCIVCGYMPRGSAR